MGTLAQQTPDYVEVIQRCTDIPQLLADVKFMADSPMAQRPLGPIYCISKVSSQCCCLLAMA